VIHRIEHGLIAFIHGLINILLFIDADSSHRAFAGNGVWSIEEDSVALSSWTFEIPYACCLVFIVGIFGSIAAAASEPPVAGPQPTSSGPPISDGGRAGSGQRVTIQSTTLENLLLEKGVIAQVSPLWKCL
jgi:hypothetical protein